MDSLNGIKAINTDIFFKNFYFIVVTLYRCHFAWWIAARYNKYDVMISVLEPNGSICYFSVLKSTSICSHIGINKCTPLICLYICSRCTRRTLNMVSSRHKKSILSLTAHVTWLVTVDRTTRWHPVFWCQNCVCSLFSSYSTRDKTKADLFQSPHIMHINTY